MTESIYARKSTVLIVAILTSIVLLGTTISFIVWFNYDKNYGIGEIVIRKNQDFENRYDFPGSGTSNNPYLIKDYILETNKEYAIYITGTTKYFLITNCTIKCSLDGISIRDVVESTARIENNEIQITSQSHSSAIIVYESPNSTIKNNELACIGDYTNADGIQLGFSQNSLISNNTCQFLSDGIYVFISDAVLIEFNFVDYCKSGIAIYQSDSSIIRYNALYYNQYNGINSRENSGCIFHHNNFIGNSYNSYYDEEQAIDSSINIWYDVLTNEGNYWSDLIWNDGAVYYIGGYGDCVDFYPLQFPVII